MICNVNRTTSRESAITAPILPIALVSGVAAPATRISITGNPPYSISPYSAVKRYSGKGDTTLHDAPPLRSTGRISSGAARRSHLVAVPPLDLGAMLTADP
jgi:hypothetical protein